MQKYENYEVILINDGSTDRSKEICEEFCKHNRKFKLINQLNMGVSKSRNNGLKRATGDLIMFVDSDDIIEEKTFSYVVENMKDNDMLCFGYNLFFKDYKKKILIGMDLSEINQISEKIIVSNEIGGYLWNKVFKREIIIKSTLEFKENIHFCEDLLFVCEYLEFCKNAKYLNINLYNYRMRRSSVSYNFYNEKNVSILNSYEILLSKYSYNSDYYNHFCFQYVTSYYKFRKILKNTNVNINESILKNERKIVKKTNFNKKVQFYLLKYFPTLYIMFRNYKNKKMNLFD